MIKSHEYGLSRRVLDVQNLKKRLISRDDYRKFRVAFELGYRYPEKEDNRRVIQVRIDNFTTRPKNTCCLNGFLTKNIPCCLTME